MRLFGLDIRRAKAMQPVSGWRGGWRVIGESYPGGWQQNQSVSVGDLSCYPTLYACLNRISQDIGKLPFVLKRVDDHGIWNPVAEQSPFKAVLKKPNNYQTGQQFRESWILSKLINGNTYVLKVRDARGVVVRMFVLDPARVMPMVAESGDVYYQLNYSTGQNLLPLDYPAEQLVIPASEIIHDRLNTFHHPLVGVPPLCAAYWPVVKNLNILKNASQFFQNHAQPGGILTAPAGMSEEDAAAVKTFWDTNYGGENRGKIAVLGADMKFTSFAVNGADSQLVEQMQYSDQQICQPFGVPSFKVGIGSIPAGLGVDAINQLYYADALQAHIEAMEYLLDDGLTIPAPMGVECDLEPLLRMDEGKKADVATKLVGGKIMLPNEARRQFDLAPTDGGETLWGQQQDYPLGVLANRADWDPQMQKPASTPVPTVAPTEGDANDEAVKSFLDALEQDSLRIGDELADAMARSPMDVIKRLAAMVH